MATIKDIAKETGLGLATISSYLNGGNVREKNRIKIEEAIKKLHYEVNETARGLKTNKTTMLGALIPELDSTFSAKILMEIEDMVRAHGYGLMVCDCRSDRGREKETLEFMKRRRVDGLFYIPVDETGKNLQAAFDLSKPVVLIDRKADGLSSGLVGVNNREAMTMAVRHLRELGHEHIGMIAGPDTIQIARDRRAGFEEACLKCGISDPEKMIYTGDGGILSGSEGADYLLRHFPEMTALIASNYQMSLGAVTMLNEKGIDIPGRLSVIGFDNQEFARACRPRLTIINQPVAEIGRQAAEMMLQSLGGRGSYRQVIFEAALCEGGSTASVNLGRI